MTHDLVLGLLLVRTAMTPRRPAPLPEDVPLPPIDVAALRALRGRAPAEAPRREAFVFAEVLPRAA